MTNSTIAKTQNTTRTNRVLHAMPIIDVTQHAGQMMREIQQTHKVLDDLHVPRECGGRVLSLAGRVHWLSGQLSAARSALEARKA